MPSPLFRPRHRQYSVWWQARLEAETHTKLAVLTKTFHPKRAQILRHVMQWAFAHTRGWTVDQSPPDHPHLVPILVEPELCQQVQGAAAALGAGVGAWVRQTMRQVTPEDFPPSWRGGNSAARSHESGYFRRKFGLCLDEETLSKLGALTETLGCHAAEVIHQLIAQAKLEDFPPSWHSAEEEHRAQDARRIP
jgi:hypothetical protein